VCCEAGCPPAVLLLFTARPPAVFPRGRVGCGAAYGGEGWCREGGCPQAVRPAVPPRGILGSPLPPPAVFPLPAAPPPPAVFPHSTLACCTPPLTPSTPWCGGGSQRAPCSLRGGRAKPGASPLRGGR
jgi:hypothetical protein